MVVLSYVLSKTGVLFAFKNQGFGFTTPYHATSCTDGVIVDFVAILRLLLLIAAMTHSSATSLPRPSPEIIRSLLACLAWLWIGGGAQWQACILLRGDD